MASILPIQIAQYDACLRLVDEGLQLTELPSWPEASKRQAAADTAAQRCTQRPSAVKSSGTAPKAVLSTGSLYLVQPPVRGQQAPPSRLPPPPPPPPPQLLQEESAPQFAPRPMATKSPPTSLTATKSPGALPKRLQEQLLQQQSQGRPPPQTPQQSLQSPQPVPEKANALRPLQPPPQQQLREPQEPLAKRPRIDGPMAGSTAKKAPPPKRPNASELKARLTALKEKASALEEKQKMLQKADVQAKAVSPKPVAQILQQQYALVSAAQQLRDQGQARASPIAQPLPEAVAPPAMRRSQPPVPPAPSPFVPSAPAKPSPFVPSVPAQPSPFVPSAPAQQSPFVPSAPVRKSPPPAEAAITDIVVLDDDDVAPPAPEEAEAEAAEAEPDELEEDDDDDDDLDLMAGLQAALGTEATSEEEVEGEQLGTVAQPSPDPVAEVEILATAEADEEVVQNEVEDEEADMMFEDTTGDVMAPEQEPGAIEDAVEEMFEAEVEGVVGGEEIYEEMEVGVEAVESEWYAQVAEVAEEEAEEEEAEEDAQVEFVLDGEEVEDEEGEYDPFSTEPTA